MRGSGCPLPDPWPRQLIAWAGPARALEDTSRWVPGPAGIRTGNAVRGPCLPPCLREALDQLPDQERVGLHDLQRQRPGGRSPAIAEPCSWRASCLHAPQGPSGDGQCAHPALPRRPLGAPPTSSSAGAPAAPAAWLLGAHPTGLPDRSPAPEHRNPSRPDGPEAARKPTRRASGATARPQTSRGRGGLGRLLRGGEPWEDNLACRFAGQLQNTMLPRKHLMAGTRPMYASPA